MVYIHLATGFEEIEALTVVDILRRGEVDVKMVSVTGEIMVTGVHDVSVKADILFEQADYGECEMIILPGGMPGAENLGKHGGLAKQIQSFAEGGKTLAAICAAPMVFGALGILDGKDATCYPGMESHLKNAVIKEGSVVIDGNIITSRGPATAMPFALKLIEQLRGKAVSDQLAADLLWKEK